MLFRGTSVTSFACPTVVKISGWSPSLIHEFGSSFAARKVGMLISGAGGGRGRGERAPPGTRPPPRPMAWAAPSGLRGLAHTFLFRSTRRRRRWGNHRRPKVSGSFTLQRRRTEPGTDEVRRRRAIASFPRWGEAEERPVALLQRTEAGRRAPARVPRGRWLRLSAR